MQPKNDDFESALLIKGIIDKEDHKPYRVTDPPPKKSATKPALKLAFILAYLVPIRKYIRRLRFDKAKKYLSIISRPLRAP